MGLLDEQRCGKRTPFQQAFSRMPRGEVRQDAASKPERAGGRLAKTVDHSFLWLRLIVGRGPTHIQFRCARQEYLVQRVKFVRQPQVILWPLGLVV